MAFNPQPLAARMRPSSLADFVGQDHILGASKPLRKAIEQQHLHSMILWGPPGTGKTTLAKLIALHANAHIEIISAVQAGIKEIRAAVENAKKHQQTKSQKTILLIDEVHRFNKTQQDALLPHVEDGTVTLIGATTENPSFELNNALLSRARVYVLKPLQTAAILQIIDRALSDKENGLGSLDIDFPTELREQLALAADGDARRALNLLELIADLSEEKNGKLQVSQHVLDEVFTGSTRRFDKMGEVFYDQISALHKSVRGSDPDASLYWLARMLDGGCDPLYLARRVTRMASEDIGNADPRGLSLALDAWDVLERLGSPEGELALAQAVVYLASVPKSNAVYVAFNAAMADAKKYGSLEVPLYLRNAPTALMKKLGYSKNYRYPHDEPNSYVAGEHYFPENMAKQRYYQPKPQGLELKVAERLAQLRKLDESSK